MPRGPQPYRCMYPVSVPRDAMHQMCISWGVSCDLRHRRFVVIGYACIIVKSWPRCRCIRIRVNHVAPSIPGHWDMRYSVCGCCCTRRCIVSCHNKQIRTAKRNSPIAVVFVANVVDGIISIVAINLDQVVVGSMHVVVNLWEEGFVHPHLKECVEYTGTRTLLLS